MKTCEAKRVLGALDALGVALARHGHVWTGAERSGYEGARAGLTAMEAASAGHGEPRRPLSDEDMELLRLAVSVTNAHVDERRPEVRLRAVWTEVLRISGKHDQR